MDYPPELPRSSYNQMLAKEIEKGDYVIAYLKNKTIGGIGKVVKPVFEAQKSETWEKQVDYEFSTRIKVKWKYVDSRGWRFAEEPKNFLGIQNLRTATIHEMTPTHFKNVELWLQRQVRKKNLKQDITLKSVSVMVNASDLAIREQALRDFIANHVKEIFNDKWDLFVDEEGIEGIEYKLKSKYIDLILVDENDMTNIIEIKVVHANESVVLQLQEYIELYEEMFGDKAKGILIAPSIGTLAEELIRNDKKLRYMQFNPHLEFTMK